MTLSMILTVNNRSHQVSKAVAQSLECAGNQPDELIVVLDRPTKQVRIDTTLAYGKLNSSFPVKYVLLDGEPGWKGPARAWNAGFRNATGDVFYCISSEVVQDAGNVDKMRKHFWDDNDPKNPTDLSKAVFGACHNSEKTNLVVGAEPGLLVSSKMPRPLGFIVAMPAERVHQIRGFDEAFMAGFWYDDDDFFLRLWRTGINFVFDDNIHGTHLDHPRPDLETPEGQAGIHRNAALMLRKHGTNHPWNTLPRTENRARDTLTWEHI